MNEKEEEEERKHKNMLLISTRPLGLHHNLGK